MTTEQKITSLTGLWYRLIAPIHHKDRDCHFAVKKQWSYGSPPVYLIEHYGYLRDEQFPEFKTAEAAQTYLLWTLEKMLRDWIDSAKSDDGGEWNEFDLNEVAAIENELNNICTS